MLFANNVYAKKLRNNLFLFLLFTTVLYTIYFYGNYKYSDNHIKALFKKELLKLKSENNNILIQLKNTLNSGDVLNSGNLFKRFINEKKAIYVFHNDSLIFWNNNKIKIDKIITGLSKDTLLIYFTKNNLYLTEFRKTGQYGILIAGKFKKGFTGCNKKKNNKNLCVGVGAGNAEYLISIKKSPIAGDFTSLIFLADYFLLFYIILLLYNLLTQKRDFRLYYFLFFIFDLLILRFADFYFEFPAFIKNTSLFKKELTGFYMFDTAGDIFINVLITYFIFHFLYINGKSLKRNRITNFIVLTLSYSIILFYFTLVDRLLVNQGVDFIFRYRQFDFESLTALAIVLTVGYTTYFIIKTVNSIRGEKENKIAGIVLLGFILLAGKFIGIENVLLILAGIYVLFYTLLLFLKQRYGLSDYFYNLLVIVFISAVFSALTVITDNERMDERQIFMSNYLSQQKDPIFEYKVENLLKKFYNDTVTKSIILNDDSNGFKTEEKLIKYLNDKYLNGINRAYNHQITFCRAGEMLEIQPEGTLEGCVEYFSNMGGDTVFIDSLLSLRLINDEYKSIYYLADLNFDKADINSGFHLIIEFLKEKIPSDAGYSGILENGKSDEIHFDLFGFAVYNDTVINYKFGEFPYPVVFNELKKFPLNKFVKWNGYIHYINRINDNVFIVVSRKKKQVAYLLFPFTLYFFILQFVLLVVAGWGSLKKLKESLLNYSIKIQTIYFISFLSLFAVISVVSIYYINLSISRSIQGELEEKTYSVSGELQNRFSAYEKQTIREDNPDIYLKKLSNIFFTDINLYGVDGKLMSTSRSEIFEKNLQSDYMNVKAFFALRFDHKLFFIDKERINNTVFYSSYFPLVMQDGTLYGYINLPYFAKKNYLLNSRNLLFVSFFNLLVFIAIIILIISYFVTRMITKPLYLLQKRISDTNLNRDLAKIKWNRDDEIGHLINAYNEMVEKLKESTELLKKSERESAWREMAQQIAHEIRNPLTPMKLNIQYLQKAHKEGDKDFDNKLKNISETLITQIDALNNVAAMFSDFAKTKSDKEAVFDLKEVVLKSVNLFKNRGNVDIVFNYVKEEKYPVKGDENDFLRILNNLIKNALQSIDENRGGEIKIMLASGDGYVNLSISDNGSGIPEEFRDKIFVPYFTTKSKGTGIGLAIVYNLVKENGGEIRFETADGEGTVFYLRFPQTTNL